MTASPIHVAMKMASAPVPTPSTAHRMLTEGHDLFHAEKESLLIAAREVSTFFQTDDTGEEDRTIRSLPASSLSDHYPSGVPPIPVTPIHRSNRILVADPQGDRGKIRRASDGKTLFQLDRRVDRRVPPAYSIATGMMAVAELDAAS